MKKHIARIILVSGLLAFNSLSQAQVVAAHYPAGAEGIKGASLPPPGVYFRDYNFFYTADRFKDGPPEFDIFASLRYVYEFAAASRPEGQLVTATITRRF